MRDRSFRRWRREVVIDHAFHIRFYIWDLQNYWQEHRIIGYEKVVGVDKWECQNQNRKEVRHLASLVADNLRTCSCHLCKKHGRGGKPPRIKRQQLEMELDTVDLKEYLYGS